MRRFRVRRRKRRVIKEGDVKQEADAPTGLSRSEVMDVRSRRKQGQWYGVILHRKGREGLGLVLTMI